MKESNKLGKISFNVLATLLGTTAVAALVGIGTTLAFGLQGAKFTQGAAETSRIAELATRQDAIQDLTIPQQIVSFIPKNVFADFAGTTNEYHWGGNLCCVCWCRLFRRSS